MDFRNSVNRLNFNVQKILCTCYCNNLQNILLALNMQSKFLKKEKILSHSGRFLLSNIYTVQVKDKLWNKLLHLFKNAPDYNEKITMYQINHLSGSSGSGTQYTLVRLAKKSKVQDLCFAIPECDNIIKPLSNLERKRQVMHES